MHDAARRLDFFLRYPTVRLGHVPHDEECCLKEYGLTLSAGESTGAGRLSGMVAQSQPPVELVADQRTDCDTNDIAAGNDETERPADEFAGPAHAARKNGVRHHFRPSFIPNIISVVELVSDTIFPDTIISQTDFHDRID
jgi:hypothetical protein